VQAVSQFVVVGRAEQGVEEFGLGRRSGDADPCQSSNSRVTYSERLGTFNGFMDKTLTVS
jgi:hypothetical protein